MHGMGIRSTDWLPVRRDRHGINAPGVPGMTPGNATQAHPEAPNGSIPLNGLIGVFRTTRPVPTRRGQNGTQDDLICTDQSEQTPAQPRFPPYSIHFPHGCIPAGVFRLARWLIAVSFLNVTSYRVPHHRGARFPLPFDMIVQSGASPEETIAGTFEMSGPAWSLVR